MGLEEAGNKSSPLHGCCEWDDARAANAYRKRQARQIISAIVIVPKRKSDPHTRAFYKVEDVKGYTTRERVLETESMRQEVLHKMMIRLKQARNIYEEFAELSGVVSEIDKLRPRRVAAGRGAFALGALRQGGAVGAGRILCG